MRVLLDFASEEIFTGGYAVSLLRHCWHIRHVLHRALHHLFHKLCHFLWLVFLELFHGLFVHGLLRFFADLVCALSVFAGANFVYEFLDLVEFAAATGSEGKNAR